MRFCREFSGPPNGCVRLDPRAPRLRAATLLPMRCRTSLSDEAVPVNGGTGSSASAGLNRWYNAKKVVTGDALAQAVTKEIGVSERLSDRRTRQLGPERAATASCGLRCAPAS